MNLADKEKVIVSIDEASCADCFYVNRLWLKKGESRILDSKHFQPRVQVIGALTSEGELFISINQESYSANSYTVFLLELIEYFNI
jgi:hypothetical protein